MKTKIILTIAIALCATTCGYAEENDHREIEPAPYVIKRNFSLDNPIIIGKTDDPEKVKKWIENFVNLNYPDHQIDEISVYGNYKNYYIKLVTLQDEQRDILKNEKGDIIYIPFDVSEFKKMFKKKHASVYKEMKKNARKLRNNLPNNSTSDQPIGMDYRNPFILKNKTDDEIQKEQEEIIKKHYPNSKESLRMIWLFNNRYIERVSLNIGKNKFGEDQFVILNFDITAHMLEYLKSRHVIKTKISERVIQIER